MVGTSSDKTVTIRNSGSGPLILSSDPVVTGATFALTTPPASLTVAAGSTTTAVVSFAPVAVGDQTGNLSIANNTATLSPYTIDLTGTGLVTPTGFTVTGANGATTISTAGGTL